MANTGRPRKPTALHLLQGTMRASTRANRKNEAQVKLGRPEPTPEILADPAARAYWESLADRLEGIRVLSPHHREGLAALAQALADRDRCRANLRELGWPADAWREHRRSERLTALVVRLLGEFGLTPVTQSKVSAERAAEPDQFEQFLSGTTGRSR